jgi:hypothetical protein
LRGAAEQGSLRCSGYGPGSAVQRDRTMLRIAGRTLHRVRDTRSRLRGRLVAREFSLVQLELLPRLELLEVFGEFDRSRIKLLHAIKIVPRVRVVVAGKQGVGEDNAFYLRARRQFANLLGRKMIVP